MANNFNPGFDREKAAFIELAIVTVDYIVTLTCVV